MVHDPPKWDIFDKHGPYIDGHKFRVLTTTGHVNRFKARYRAAKALESIELKDFSAATEPGYLALTKTLFVYSAFERFLAAIGVKQKKTTALLARYPVSTWVATIRAADHGNIIYSFLLMHGNPDATHRGHIQAYLDGRPFNYTYLPSIVRHGFAHGHLSPGAGGALAGQVETICKVLVASMFEIMDTEFSERMDELKRVASAI